MPVLSATSNVSDDPAILRFSFGMENANTYVLAKNNRAIVVDVCSKEAAGLLTGRGLNPDYVILTHEHADHIWGLNELRKCFPEAKVIAQKDCSKAICNPFDNKAAQYRIYAVLRYGKDYDNEEAENRKYSCSRAEIEFQDHYELIWQGYKLRLIHTPGHSRGSSMILLDDHIVFSGDTILNEDTVMKFEGGSEEDFSRITLPVINSIRPEAYILPGHGEPFYRRDWERKKN